MISRPRLADHFLHGGGHSGRYATGHEEKCLIVNRIARFALFVFIYPAVLIALFMIGSRENYGDGGAIFIFLMLLIIAAVFCVLRYKAETSSAADARQKVVSALWAASPGTMAFDEAVEKAFSQFDFDRSGSLDYDEARELMLAILKTGHYDSGGGGGGGGGSTKVAPDEPPAAPLADPSQMPAIMLQMRKFIAGDGTFSLPRFLDAMTHVLALLKAVPDALQGQELYRNSLFEATRPGMLRQPTLGPIGGGNFGGQKSAPAPSAVSTEL